MIWRASVISKRTRLVGELMAPVALEKKQMGLLRVAGRPKVVPNKDLASTPLDRVSSGVRKPRSTHMFEAGHRLTVA